MNIQSRYQQFRRSGMTATNAISAARTLVQFSELEDQDLVRITATEEQESYFAVYGDPDTEKERKQITHEIELNGCWFVFTEYKCACCGRWNRADSIGMCVYSNPLDPLQNWYVPDLMYSAIQSATTAPTHYRG